jgi:hypothetical protein
VDKAKASKTSWRVGVKALSGGESMVEPYSQR